MTFRFANLTDQERKQRLRLRRIETESTREVSRELRRLLEDAGTGSEGDGIFVLGETRAGKTTAVRMFTDEVFHQLRGENPSGEWLRPEVPATDLRPIIHRTAYGIEQAIAVLAVNSEPTFKSFMHDTAMALGVSLRANANYGDASRSVQSAILAQKVKMIIFDEVQHIMRARMQNFRASDVFKLLLNSRVQLVFIGLPEAVHLKQVNEQLEGRQRDSLMVGPLRCHLEDFPELDAHGRPKGGRRSETTEYQKILAAIDKSAGEASFLPFDAPSNLADPEMAMRLHQAGGGYLGNIMKLIQNAGSRAIDDGSKNITRGHFAEVYRRRKQCNDEDNYFLMSWKQFENRFGEILDESGDEEPQGKSTAFRARITRHVKDVVSGRR